MRNLIWVLINLMLLGVGCSQLSQLQPESKSVSEHVFNSETPKSVTTKTAQEDPVEKRIKELIVQLGNNKWRKREQATTELLEIGELALPFLKETLKNTSDAEIRMRVNILIRKIACLIAYWNFDETSGIIAKDSSGNGNYGIVHGAKWVNGALSFDGVDDYVEIADNSSFDVGDSLTLEAWIKTTTKNGGRVISSQRQDTGQSVAWLMRGAIEKGQSVVQFRDSSKATSSVVGKTAIADGEWHHIVGVLNRTEIKLYIDGRLDNSTSFANNGDFNARSYVTIGRYQAAYLSNSYHFTGEYFNGLIDEIKIYNRVLSAEEIKANYKKGK